MKRFTAKFTKEFEIDRVTYKKGDLITLEESEEFAPAYWIVRDGVVSNDLLTNEYGTVFQLVEELQVAA